MTDERSCWHCTHQQISGPNLLGFCRWFVVNKNQGAKPIPPAIVDKGCEHFQPGGPRPLTPHYHTCRSASCPERHRWECRNERCVWNVLLDCEAGTAIVATTQETTKMETPQLPPPKYIVTDPNGTHRYRIQDLKGKVILPRLKSVTGAIGIIDKPNLKGWAAREAAAFFKGEILRLGKAALTPSELDRIAAEAAKAHERKSDAGKDFGAIFHDAAEAIVLGKDPGPLPKEAEAALKAFKADRLNSDIRIVATELATGSIEHEFGGKLDSLGWSEEFGGWGIEDYKTSNGIYGNEYAYQAGGGYAIGIEEQYGIEIKWARVSRFSKKPPFNAEAVMVTDMAAAKEGFLLALRLSRSTGTKLLSAPVWTFAGENPLVPPPAKAAPKSDAGKKASPVGF